LYCRHDSAEEGELESDNEMLNPMVTVTKIDPSEIPEVSHQFLMRGRRSRSNDRDGEKNKDRDRGFGWSKKSVPQSRSGRTIKGRGNFRYRTPSRSRSRSFTPEHWKAAQRNVIKITDFERLEEQKKTREAEMDRRAEERKKRHDAIVKGDGKKSFFELAQDAPEVPVLTIASSLTRPEKSGSVDLNALDYEESDSDREVRENIKMLDEKSEKNGKATGNIKSRLDRNRSRSRGSPPRRSRSRERFNKDRRDFRPAQRNRFNDNRRWDNKDNPRSFNRNRIDAERWSHSRNRTNSKSRSRSR
jgi:peptidyl-prolyl isomerase G (cyclophilin G)